MQVGFWEVMLTLIVAVVVLGPERLPKAAYFLGKSLAGVKKAMRSLQDEAQGFQLDGDSMMDPAIKSRDDESKSRGDENRLQDDKAPTRHCEETKSTKQPMREQPQQ